MELISELEVIVRTWVVFEVDECLALLAGSQVGMIAEEEALTHQSLLDSFYKVDYLLWQHGVALYVFVKRDEFYAFYQEDYVSCGQCSSRLSFRDDHNEDMTPDVQDSYDAKGVVLRPSFHVAGLRI